LASTKNSSLLDRFKGKQIDIRTTAEAHVIGTLDDADNDFLLMLTNNQQVLMPRSGVALMYSPTQF
jgi:hypothetical protein